MQISVGPLYFYWHPNQVTAFYAELAEQPVDRIYLGEVVCSKRRDMRLSDWVALGQDLKALGKDIVLSTLTLIEAESEMSTMKRVVDNGEFQVECNDLAAVQFARERKLAFTAGPALNIYNHHTLATLVEQGLTRWVPPVELSRDDIADIQSNVATLCPAPELEIFSWGYLPLAWSARCFSARYRDLPKDQCGFCCQEYPPGLSIETLEDQQVFRINGIQTLSHDSCNLLDQWPAMQSMGATTMRLSLDDVSTVGLVEQLRNNIDRRTPERIAITPDSEVNGYWFGKAGMLREG